MSSRRLVQPSVKPFPTSDAGEWSQARAAFQLEASEALIQGGLILGSIGGFYCPWDCSSCSPRKCGWNSDSWILDPRFLQIPKNLWTYDFDAKIYCTWHVSEFPRVIF